MKDKERKCKQIWGRDIKRVKRNSEGRRRRRKRRRKIRRMRRRRKRREEEDEEEEGHFRILAEIVMHLDSHVLQHGHVQQHACNFDLHWHCSLHATANHQPTNIALSSSSSWFLCCVIFAIVAVIIVTVTSTSSQQTTVCSLRFWSSFSPTLRNFYL